MGDIFFSIHNHTDVSNFKNRDSICKVEKLIDRAFDLEFKGLAITDHEALSMHIKALKYYENEYKDTDFKVALGNEIYLVHNLDKIKQEYVSGVTKFYHFLLVAKDRVGHDILRELSSQAWDNYFVKGTERTPITYNQVKKIIGDRKGHLIASTACLGGYLPIKCLEYINSTNPIKSEKIKSEIHKFITWCIDIFGKENFYLEIQPSDTQEQSQVNKMILNLAKVYKLKHIITTDTHYYSKEDKPMHKAFITADDGSKEREVDAFYGTTYMMSIEEMWEFLKDDISRSDFDDGIKNTLLIYDDIEMYSLKDEVRIPQMEIPNFKVNHIFKNFYYKYPYLNNYANSPNKADQYFLSLVERGFLNKNQEFNDINIKRINDEMKELWLISEKLHQSLASYYNITEKIIEIIWERAKSIVGIGRGSGAGMYVCYLLDIVQANPIIHSLPYYRHITATRPELPDLDFDSSNIKRPTIIQELRKYFGEKSVLNICTFKREGSKSTVITACRGLGISNDIAQTIADIIPVERGQSWDIEDCLYGNEEKDRKPIPEFINSISKYEGLLEAVLSIQGLISGRSVHASGVFVYSGTYLENNNALMKTPKGLIVSQFDMGDSTYVGNLKFDVLTIEAIDKIQTCMEMLIEDGLMEWKGSLRDTYNYYLHPDKLDYKSPKMWDLLGEGKIIDVFQFSTDIGIETIKKVKARSLEEMISANSLMRLMPLENGETPTNKFIRFKNDINLWYKECEDFELTSDEIKTLETHYLPVYGVPNTQEDLMECMMNPKISNFTLADANFARKIVGKKQLDKIPQLYEMYVNHGKNVGTSKKLLDYVWKTCAEPQLGYAFSRNHCCDYSLIGLQEMNLAYKYPIAYWNCAVLSCNSGAMEDDDTDKKASTQYGKIAKAIGELQHQEVTVYNPDINKSKFKFSVDKENYNIFYGLKGITKINDDDIRHIINNRPYSSLEDFYDKTYKFLSKSKIVSLIKGGCFDNIEGTDRIKVMEKFIHISTTDYKTSLTLANLKPLLENDLIPKEYKLEVRLYKFKNHILKINNATKGGKKWIKLDTKYALPFFEQHYAVHMKPERDLKINNNGDLLISSSALDRVTQSLIEPLISWLNTEEALRAANKILFENNWNKYAKHKDIYKWEMESISFYSDKHELDFIDLDSYGVCSYFDLPTEPTYDHYNNKKVMNTYTVAGTVIDKNKNKHTVSLLTPTGVVTVKFSKGAFNYYNKKISEVESRTGKKKVIDNSWFERGSLLLIKGFRQEDRFVARNYSGHTVAKIIGTRENNLLWLQIERQDN